MPFARLGAQRGEVHADECAVIELAFARDPHVADLLASGRVDELRRDMPPGAILQTWYNNVRSATVPYPPAPRGRMI